MYCAAAMSSGPTFFSSLLGIALLIVLSGCGSTARSSIAAEDAIRRYQDGQRMVAVRVMLDRLLVQRVSQAGRPATVEVTMFRTPVASVGDLEAVARQMRAAQSDIIGISAYVSQVDAPQAQPQRLTSRFTVRVQAGTDPALMLERVRARIVEVVSYSPDTVICEAESPSLLAALDATASLAQTAGVVFATPLIERSLSHR